MSNGKDHFIGGHWLPGEGLELASTDPSTGAVNWAGRTASAAQVDQAVQAAAAAAEWGEAPFFVRAATLRRVAERYGARKPDLVEAISRETGKPRWEAATEVDAMVAKVGISIDAFERRTADSARGIRRDVCHTLSPPRGGGRAWAV